MPNARIVVLEADAPSRRQAVDALRGHGYHVLEACDARCGLHEAISGTVDLILLDAQLPSPNGCDVLSELRRKAPTKPVILLTSQQAEEVRIHGLQMGAADCIAKPISARELNARVDAVLRRTLKPCTEVCVVHHGRACIDLNRREVRWSEQERGDLSETEAAVLKYLVNNRERAVSRDELLGRVWGIGTAGLATRAVDMHIARIRAKLKDPTGQECDECIITVRSRGYMAGPGLAVAAASA